MNKNRLEAFSDGVLAIILTIMVLEMKVPHEPELAAVLAVGPVFCSYVLSFVYVGIYWNNHHHMLHATKSVSGGILWANLHLLFWLSLVPFTTSWMGEHPSHAWPAALYGANLFAAGIAYLILQQAIIANNGGEQSALATMIGRDVKGKISGPLYLAGIGVAFVSPLVSEVIYVLVALMWVVPDRRIERSLAGEARE